MTHSLQFTILAIAFVFNSAFAYNGPGAPPPACVPGSYWEMRSGVGEAGTEAYARQRCMDDIAENGERVCGAFARNNNCPNHLYTLTANITFSCTNALPGSVVCFCEELTGCSWN